MFAMLFFVFAIIVQSHVPITLFLVNGSVKLIPVAIQFFQQRGLEISIRFLQTIVLHRIVIHVVITHVNDNFFQVFYQLIHRTPGFLYFFTPTLVFPKRNEFLTKFNRKNPFLK